jgi:hypothetical protein
MVERVEPEAVHPAIQPEPHDIEQGVLHRGVVDVELRLFLEELVIVILRRRASQVQAGPPKTDCQLLGGVPSGSGSAQTYQSASGFFPVRAALREPCMVVRRMGKEDRS